MKKIYSKIICAIGLLVASGIGQHVQAQNAAQYGFTPVSSTFVEITGTAFTAAQVDDALPAATIPIGFTFNYCGANYTTIRASSNGYMAFLASSGSVASNTQANLNTIKPALMWLWDDLDGSTGAAVYTTSGTAPNRVFTFQYKNWEWNWSTTGPNITVQVKLFETTNVIEYHYRQESAAGNPGGSGGATIGICDNNATPTYLTLNNAGTAPTASPTTFTDAINTKPANGQIYRFAPPPDCSNAIGMPTAGTTTASPASICLGGSVNLSFTPASAMPAVLGISYNWQYGPSATGPWTNIPGGVTTIPTFSYTGAAASQYYRAQVLCNNNVIINATASNLITVSTFTAPTITNGTRCGPGVVNLAATSTGNVIRWYQNATGGIPLFSGNNFTTPFITNSTTYYVSAGSAAVTDSVVTGPGSLTTLSGDYTTIFSGGWGGYKHQFLITQAELAAIGILPGNNITNIGVTATTGGTTYNGFTMSLLPTNVNALTTTFETGATAVYGPLNYTTLNGYNNYTLTTPYTYTGGNLIIQTCWSNATSSNPYTHLLYDNTSFASTHYYYQDNVPPATVCALTSGGSTVNKRPKFTFKTTKYCETQRYPATATVTTSNIVTNNAPAIVCNNDIVPINITSPLGNYNNYIWTALDGGSLYTNANATNPYIANTNATSIYLRTTIAGNQRIVISALNTSNNCASYDTINVWVQPENIQLIANTDTLCVPGGTATMTLSPNTNYAPGSIIWETSTDGVNYTVVPNGNNVSLTTPFIAVNTTRYYRVKINKTNGICQTIIKQFVVSDPTIITVKDSFNCGPGQIQLEVTTGGFADVTWYEQATGGLSVGTGNIFITPFLNTSKTYYAAAKGGGSLQGQSIVGTGTLTASGYQSPFYHFYGGHKNQFLILASDILAQGIPAGSMITSLGIDVISGSTTYNDFTLQLGTTNLTALNTGGFVGGMTQVTNTAPHTVSTGWNTFTFTTPFYWDGTNLVVQTCYNNNNSGGTSTAVRHRSTNYVGTIYQRQDNVATATICGNNTVYGSTSTVPNFRFNYDKSCESARVPVLAEIREKPSVDLGPDYSKCVDSGHLEFLDAGNPGSNYIWDNQYNGQVRVVNASGTYYVKVTNAGGCEDADTINITFKNNPKSALGNDTTVCNKQSVLLDAGNDGMQYYWNTGATTPKITVNSGGTYFVQIIGANGCIKTDTITVIQNGEKPTLSGIQIQNQAPYTFKFNALNPANVIGYRWDFGDGSPYSYQNSPIHTYNAIGNYLVTLWVSSTCGTALDTMTAHIYSNNINNIVDDNSVKLYPNPTNDVVTIEPSDGLKIEQVIVYDILGKLIINNTYTDHVNRTIDLNKYADGMYQLQIITNKGIIHKKVEKITK